MNITLLRCLAFLLLVLCLPVSAKANHSGDFGHGIVRMQGSIITTACAIDTKSRDQTIDMSVLPINQLVNNGWSHINLPKHFSISSHERESVHRF